MSAQKKRVRKAFRAAVFERDGYTCRGCGFESSPERAEAELDAHHITDRNEMPNGGYVAENGISLCAECHGNAEAHHRGAPVPPGFAPHELYELIGASEAEARAAAEG
jgi:5-methylcytosine-specific restriction endonuclease McrA